MYHFHIEQECCAEWNLQKNFTYNYAITYNYVNEKYLQSSN